MLSNIIIFFIILITLVIIFGTTAKIKESFFDFPVSHTNYVEESKQKYNTLSSINNPTDPVLKENNDTISIALNSVIATPNSNGYSLKLSDDFRLLPSISDNFKKAALCEAKPASCDAFDDQDFSNSCGISFDQNGTDSNGKRHMGGKFISRMDKTQQLKNIQETTQSGGDWKTIAQPSIGTSKRGTFALTKDQCIIIKETIECQEKQSFTSPNCGQCYSSGQFYRIDPSSGKIPSTLYLFGSGIISINGDISLQETSLNTDKGVQLNIPYNAEGMKMTISVKSDTTNSNVGTFLCGFIQGQTARGNFRLDIFHLFESDLISNTKPRIGGTNIYNGYTCLVMMPSVGQTSMNLTGIIPFSFYNITDEAVRNCDNGPIITNATSATFLESDPCFSKSNKPGSYSLECLQQRWLELGGTQKGSGYPSTQAKADLLQKSSDGKGIDIDTIINTLYYKIKQAITGQNVDGSSIPLTTWNDLSMWATGTSISSPCDGPNKNMGPLSKECLSYLYTNSGAGKSIGATYTLPPTQASMKNVASGNIYCQANTPLDPNTDSGYNFAKNLGGVDSVKQAYDTIHRTANDNTLTNEQRSDAIMKCYGISVDKIDTPSPSATSPSGCIYNTIQGGDHGGGDYKQLYNGTLQECISACCSDSQCLAYSYTADPSLVNQATCFMKNIVTELNVDPKFNNTYTGVINVHGNNSS